MAEKIRRAFRMENAAADAPRHFPICKIGGRLTVPRYPERKIVAVQGLPGRGPDWSRPRGAVRRAREALGAVWTRSGRLFFTQG